MLTKKFLCLCILSSSLLLLIGCSETDENFTEAGHENVITENVDLTKITVPDEVKIYRFEQWDEKSNEEICNVLLKGNVTEVTSGAPGLYYSTDYLDENLFIYDAGVSYYGEQTLPTAVQFNYSCLNGSEVSFSVIEDIELYQEKPDTEIIKQKEVQQALQLVDTYMEQLEFPAFDLHGVTSFPRTEDENQGYLFTLRQTVDGIPFSAVGLPKFGATPQGNPRFVVYNSTLPINPNIAVDSSMLRVAVLDNEVIEWSCAGMKKISEMLESYPIVTVEEAYAPIQTYYQSLDTSNSNPRLNAVELQYECLEINGEEMLFPIWMFAILEDEELHDSYTNETIVLEVWHYYLINAITGEFFVDADVE